MLHPYASYDKPFLVTIAYQPFFRLQHANADFHAEVSSET